MTTTAQMARHPAERPLRKFLFSNRAAFGSLAVFGIMLLIFFVANPRVFSSWGLYAAVLTTLPVALFMVAPLVFVVTSGEIDLSFPAIMGFTIVIAAAYVLINLVVDLINIALNPEIRRGGAS